MYMHAFLKRVPPEAVQRCIQNADFATSFLSAEQPGTETLGLKESWDGLHYIMNAKRRRPAKELDTMVVWDNSELLAAAILGKEILNKNCKNTFGVPRWIEPAMVVSIAKRLSELNWMDLADEIVPENMSHCGVYPDWLWESEDKAVKFLKYWFQRLVSFYAASASESQAIIAYLKV